jgi:hypothetical protein
MLNATYSKRFEELSKNLSIFSNPTIAKIDVYAPTSVWRQWATSAESLIRAVYGEQDPHYVHFAAAFKHCTGRSTDISALNGYFHSAKEDFDNGYVFNADLRVSGEVFGDFIALARKALGGGHKDVAAVLACAALEDALKRYAQANALDVEEKTMQEVVNSLKSKGLVAGAQKTLLDAMPRIRNLAMHAEWPKISEPDVSSVLGFVEQFLLTKFSPA